MSEDVNCEWIISEKIFDVRVKSLMAFGGGDHINSGLGRKRI